ncbi:MAG TPA: trypsin-like peptidase domain-containing protein, partial [Nakamurella sp.]
MDNALPIGPTDPDAASAAALDAYSGIVSAVAAAMVPSVAAVSVPGPAGSRRGGGSGSAVLFTDDGYLLTNAHVVGEATHGIAEFADGSDAQIDVVGADPLSDLAVVRARSGLTVRPVTLGSADALRVGQLVV